METGATTLLIKVKDHRGDPLNEEADIRAELDRLKEYKETIWNDSSDRTVYECPVTSTKHGGATVLKTSVWSNTVRNYIRQKAGEIEAYKALEIGAQKWCKEHIPRNGNDLTEEGQILLEDPELRLETINLLMGMSRIEKTRTHYGGCHILATQQRSYYIHLYRRLAPDRGGKPRQTGRMSKENTGPTSRPEENN